ncbi:MAG TPA: DUF177 domain-containing protein [Candidatus Dormibacteraeota bacterium]|nr:DUF177 domain-containing protein [Candidatus Dormibacteraeota bacterium]
MFLDIHELALHRIPIRKSYLPGGLDFHSTEFKQVEPLVVRATAELVEGQIHIFGNLHTRIELNCARCLESVPEEVSRDFDLLYRPMVWAPRDEAVRLSVDESEIAFFEGDGLFLADIISEQINLAVPMKVICRSDCRGLCAHCGANLNYEQCSCEARIADPRLASLERFKLEWFKKH